MAVRPFRSATSSIYVEFAAPSKHIKLGVYQRRALAKDAGVSPDGSGSHRLAIGSEAGPCTDPTVRPNAFCDASSSSTTATSSR